MGVNNRQRRAAKKKRSSSRRRATEAFVTEPTPELARAMLLDALASIDADATCAEPLAEVLCRPDGPLPPDLAQQALQSLLGELTAGVVAHGWRPTDVVQIVTRQLNERSAAQALWLVVNETDAHTSARVSARWRDDLGAAGMPVPIDLRDVPSVQAALRLATLLSTLPPIAVIVPAPGSGQGIARPTDGGDPRLLAKVRALLSKAESTEYDEEAEALSAKAQELISRHALERLLAEADTKGAPDATTSAQRIWIDPPYVFAKALLVAAVAEANHCRSVVSEGLGFCTVVGKDGDLAAVDVLVTSLLLQSGVAMRRHGRHQDRGGTSRTRSFRQSFLVAYASRVRERLHSAAGEAVQSSGRAGELVPVLHRRAEQVDAATEQLFPELRTRSAAIGNAQGWAAGRAAADQARLEVAEPLEAAG